MGGATYTLTATGGASGNPVTFTVDASSTTGCLHIAGASSPSPAAGTCVIDANQAGNADYTPPPGATDRHRRPGLPDHHLHLTAPAATVGGATYTPTATGGASGNPVTFTVDASSTTGCV